MNRQQSYQTLFKFHDDEILILMMIIIEMLHFANIRNLDVFDQTQILAIGIIFQTLTKYSF